MLSLHHVPACNENPVALQHYMAFMAGDMIFVSGCTDVIRFFGSVRERKVDTYKYAFKPSPFGIRVNMAPFFLWVVTPCVFVGRYAFWRNILKPWRRRQYISSICWYLPTSRSLEHLHRRKKPRSQNCYCVKRMCQEHVVNLVGLRYVLCCCNLGSCTKINKHPESERLLSHVTIFLNVLPLEVERDLQYLFWMLYYISHSKKFIFLKTDFFLSCFVRPEHFPSTTVTRVPHFLYKFLRIRVCVYGNKPVSSRSFGYTAAETVFVHLYVHSLMEQIHL